MTDLTVSSIYSSSDFENSFTEEKNEQPSLPSYRHLPLDL
jgi:hypothetical protein